MPCVGADFERDAVRQFMRITDSAIADLKINPDNVFLAQGTLRPDLIESGSHIASAKADVIKVR